jgi:hypothetical protein
MSEPTSKPRRWYRWLTQFSLRSLLILVTVSAVGCWWFLRPKSQEEQLAGKLLVLRRQVRTIKNPVLNADPAFQTLSDGSWQLKDEFGGLLADGKCVQDAREGRWTLYHPNGQKAAEGEVLHGARHGLWQVWDADGSLVSEVTYQAPEYLQPGPALKPRPFVTGSVIPVVGATSLADSTVLPQFGGGGMVGGGMFFGGPPVRVWPPGQFTRSLRHGPCRVWHTRARSVSKGVSTGTQSVVSEGQPSLAYEGQYELDQRTGFWIWYDEQGRVLERGNFVADRREGEWTIRDSVSGKNQKITYIAGHNQAEHDRLLAGIAADLASGSIRRQLAGITRIEALGRHGWPLLVPLLKGKNPELKLLALRTLVRQHAFPAEALPHIEPLTSHPDRRLAIRAKTAIYIAKPERREEMINDLLDQLEPDHTYEQFCETTAALFRADERHHREIIESLLKKLAPLYTQGLGSGWSFVYSRAISRLGTDAIPHLDAAYQNSAPPDRVFILHVLANIVANGPVRRPLVNEHGVVYEIPAAAQPLLERAKSDPDPQVQEAARRVGMSHGGYGGGMGGISGGFF